MDVSAKGTTNENNANCEGGSAVHRKRMDAAGGARGPTENTPANENRKEQSYMTDGKVIMLIEAKIQPQRRAELLEALREYLPLVRAEPGVEAFYVSARKDDPNAVVFYEVYKSQAAQDFHLQQDFTKKFLATLKSAQAADRVRTNLVELPQR
jgi:quinol monooxygenase YgiN